jgi:hypothetical protein
MLLAVAPPRLPIPFHFWSSLMSSPTRLQVSDLLFQADLAAAQVLDGCYTHLWPDGGLPKARRWFVRLRCDEESEVWLVSWVPGESTGLHGHGESVGALTVISARWTKPIGMESD